MALCGAAALVVVMSPRVAWWCVVWWHVERAVAVTAAMSVSVSLVRARGVAGLVTSRARARASYVLCERHSGSASASAVL